MKKAEEFKQAAKTKKISRFHIDRCSMCKYPLDWVFSPDYEHVGFDIGCDCTSRYLVNPSSYEDIANYYNMQKTPGHIKEMNDFWGFSHE